MRPRDRPFALGVRLGLVHQVRHPGGDRLHQHLRAFTLEEFEHVEIAVAFGGLRPELAGDFHHRFHARAVHFHGVELLAAFFQRVEVDIAIEVLANLPQRVEGIAHGLLFREVVLRPFRRALHDFKRRPVAQRGGELVHRALEHLFGLALVHLEGPHLIDQVVHHVPDVQGVQHAQPEIHGELQPRLAGSGFQAVAIVEEQHAEAVEPGVLQREAIFGFVHAEAARAAGSRRKKYVVIEYVLARLACLLERLQVFHQVADRKIRRIALAVVAILLAQLKPGNIRHGDALAVVSGAEENGADEFLVLPGKSAKKNRDAAALFRGERALDGLVKMFRGFQTSQLPQPEPFRCQTLGNLAVLLNLHQSCRH